MNSILRFIINATFLLLSFLLIILGIASLGVAAWQWASVVSDDVTVGNLLANHARYTRTLIALFLIFGGCLALVGLAGVVVGSLLLANRLKGTAVLFLAVFCLSSCFMVTAYIIMTTFLWSDYTLVTPLVFDELMTRLSGTVYFDNSFQFGSYWDAWQLENRCCGINNSTEFNNSLAAINSNSPVNWLPNSCCWNQTLALGSCKWTDPSYFATPCRFSLYTALTDFYWSQLGVMIAIWGTYFILLPVTLAAWRLVWIPRE
ncbi:hypothetical protein LOD99_15439 [Oopsacas minuta]|uniref:Tetraspanin n=1 Tax=Oopsacas minuta TaxID=111878 RepID=A0AAV7KB42_9METZ|nr:hypothetical protein LOD99_15439 [Oopsacas minuta]